MKEITEKLVALAARGDQGAIAELYEISYDPVYKSLRATLADEDLVLDVMQDSYIKAFRNLHQLEKPERFIPWVKQIAANRAKDCLRKKRPTFFSEMENEEGEEPEFVDMTQYHDPAEALDRKETSRLVQEMLASLSQEQRMVMGLFYYEQRSIREIAEMLDCSENTVKSRLNYGRKNVESKVRELEKRGVKLYSMAPLPLFLWLLGQDLSVAAAPSGAMLQTITAQCAAGAAAAGSAAAGTAASGAAASGAAASGAAASGSTASGAAAAAAGTAKTALAVKIGAGVLAAAVTVGGAAAVLKPDTLPKALANREYILQRAEDEYRHLSEQDLSQFPDYGVMNAGAAECLAYLNGEDMTFYAARYDLDGDGLREGLIAVEEAGEMRVIEITSNMLYFYDEHIIVEETKPLSPFSLIHYSLPNPGLYSQSLWDQVFYVGLEEGQFIDVDSIPPEDFPHRLWEDMTLYTDGTARLEGDFGTQWMRLRGGLYWEGEPTEAPEVELSWEKLEFEPGPEGYVEYRPDFEALTAGLEDSGREALQNRQNGGIWLLDDGDWGLELQVLTNELGYVLITGISQDAVITGLVRWEDERWVLELEEGELYLAYGELGRLTVTGDGVFGCCGEYRMAGGGYCYQTGFPEHSYPVFQLLDPDAEG